MVLWFSLHIFNLRMPSIVLFDIMLNYGTRSFGNDFDQVHIFQIGA